MASSIVPSPVLVPGRPLPDIWPEGAGTFRWATVTALSPLRVQLDGDTAALDVTPESLIKTSSLLVGNRVWVQFFRRRILVLGVTRTDLYVSTVLTPSTSGFVGALQTTTATTPVLHTTGPTLTFVAPPSGMVFAHSKAFAMADAAGGSCGVWLSVRSGANTSGSQVSIHIVTSNYNTAWVLAGGTNLVTDLVPGLTYTLCHVFQANAGHTASVSSAQISVQPHV